MVAAVGPGAVGACQGPSAGSWPRRPRRWGCAMTSKRIALIGVHASPLARLGGREGGGQNVYVGQLARLLTRLGHEVDIFTRRDRPDVPDIVDWCEGARIIH